MSGEPANEGPAAWETSSQYWAKHRSLIAAMFAPLTSALIDAAQIGPNQAVLDVGGGSGEPSLTIAAIVGPSGLVTYTDPSAGMVKAAQDEAERRGLTNIRFHQCPANHLSFPDNSFDVAVSRLVAMFFPDALAGLSEILRVIKPGANLSFVVWAAKEFNPFFSVVMEVLERFIPVDAEDEDATPTFRFGRPGKLANLLEAAGAAVVTERKLKFRIQAPITAERFWALRSEMSDTLRGKLAQLDEGQVTEIKSAVLRAIAMYFESGVMNFPAQTLVVTGKKTV